MPLRGNLERLGTAVALGVLLRMAADLQKPPVAQSLPSQRPGAVLHVPERNLQAPVIALTQVGLIYTNDVNFPPGSPDPSAIRKVKNGNSLTFAGTPRPGGDVTIPSGSLIFSDPESEEVDPGLFNTWLPYGNTFATTAAGSWSATFDTRFTPSDGSQLDPPPTAQPISSEVTGIDFAPGSWFFSDDVSQRYGEVRVGPDGKFNSPDDEVITKRFASLPGFTTIDAEDLVRIDDDRLLVAGGATKQIVEVFIGLNGVGGGNDAITDTYPTDTELAQSDPEGIAICHYPYGEETIVLISNNRQPDEPFVTEFTRTNGVTRVKRYFDYSGASTTIDNAGAVDCDVTVDAQGNQTVTLWIADRGPVDTNPGDTVVVYDGVLYEFQFTETVYPVFLPAVLK